MNALKNISQHSLLNSHLKKSNSICVNSGNIRHQHNSIVFLNFQSRVHIQIAVTTVDLISMMVTRNQDILRLFILTATFHLYTNVKSQFRFSYRKRWLYSMDPNDVKFYLYPNYDNEDYRELIEIFNTTSFSQTSYNASRPLIILIHGLVATPGTVTDVQNIKNAYLAIKHEANIVMVDHDLLIYANLPHYIPFLNLIASLPANLNSFRIGRRISDFIRFLIDTKALSGPADVHMIGLGSGCFMAGMAGETITKLMSDQAQIGRISGLDCSGGQIFPSLLDASDAKFVDITYTSAGISGMLGRVGHVDFYINGGGLHQPHCQNGLAVIELYCSHFASVFYFTKSIRNRRLKGCICTERCSLGPPSGKCKDPVTYGHYVNQSARGDYYVDIPY